MVDISTRSKRSLRSSSSGFSLFEMIVASLMSTVILGFSLTVIVQQRRQFQIDQARGILNQNLRGSMDFLTADIRQGGELLVSKAQPVVPTFSLIDGASGGSDTLRVQRKLLSEEAKVTSPILAGTSVAAVVDTVPSTWVTYRQTNPATGVARSPAKVVAYIFDTDVTATAAAKRGEFFVYSGENTTTLQITRDGTWANAYKATTSFIYLLEEREYSLVADASNPGTSILRMRLRGTDITDPSGTDDSKALQIANSLTNFQVQGIFPSGAVNSLNAGGYYNSTDPDWRTLRSINVTLTAAPPSINARLTAAERTRYFGDFTLLSQTLPRNVISVSK